MNGVPMKLDYSKTLNEQLPTFEYYKNRYCSYELELMQDRKEIDRLNNIIDELEEYIRNYINLLVSKPDMIEQGQLDILYEVLDKLKALKEGK